MHLFNYRVKDTCLHIAFEKENKEVISILLEHGALVHISGAQGKSFQELVNSCPDPKKKELYTSLIQKSHEKLAKMERSLSNDIVADDGSSGESMMGSSPTNSSKGSKGSKKGTLTSSTSAKRERTISTRRYSGGKVSSPYPDKRKLGLFASKTADRTGLTQSRSTESFSSLSAIQAQARELNSASPPSPRVLAANSVLTTQQQAKVSLNLSLYVFVLTLIQSLSSICIPTRKDGLRSTSRDLTKTEANSRSLNRGTRGK